MVKVESGTRPDLSRTLAPFMDGVPGFNRSYWAYLYGTSKLSLQCNLSLEDGRKLARRVCDWADVVVESFSPGTLARMGLDYETLSADKPELIMLSTSMLGQTGPLSRYAGYGQQATGFCGMHYVTGWADRIPCGVATPYTDVVGTHQHADRPHDTVVARNVRQTLHAWSSGANTWSRKNKTS